MSHLIDWRLHTVHSDACNRHMSRFADLRNMYRLLSPIQNGLGVLVTEVEEHIKQVGLEVVTSLQGQNVSESSEVGVIETSYSYKQ